MLILLTLLADPVLMAAALALHHGHQELVLQTAAVHTSATPTVHTVETLRSTAPYEEPTFVEIYHSGPDPDTIRLKPIANGQRNPPAPELPYNDEAHPPKEILALSDSKTNLAPSKSATELMSIKGRLAVALLSTIFSFASLLGFTNHLVHNGSPTAEIMEEESWIESSNSWAARKACGWFGVCGVTHWRSRMHLKDFVDHEKSEHLYSPKDPHAGWTEGKNNPADWSDDERVMRQVPQYVLDYAPLVHLYSGEQFWPCDIADHLEHITPRLNYTTIQEQRPSLTDLDELNEWNGGRFVFLTSDDNPEQVPEWLSGEKNIPDNSDEKGNISTEPVDSPHWDFEVDGEVLDDIARKEGWYEAGEGASIESDIESGVKFPVKHGHQVPGEPTEEGRLHDDSRIRDRQTLSGRGLEGGRSDAPAVLVVVEKGNGIVDAFWFFFYSFNLGNVVLNIRFGNHVGDWEHTLVRFQHGKPKAMFFSEHNFGSAYSYEAVEKIGKRPVIYSASGTHAMYSTAGTHTYVLPFGLLHDQTDRGPLWDPLLNSHTYTYDYRSDELRSSNVTPHAPTQWFYFGGHWGDKFYPLDDERQYRFAGQFHYENGPLGPRFKNLGRKKVCGGRSSDPCRIKNWL